MIVSKISPVVLPINAVLELDGGRGRPNANVRGRAPATIIINSKEES